jgi:serine/threonine protein kinase
MAENICPQCKAPNRSSARFCSECGAPLLSSVSTSEKGPESESVPVLKQGTMLQNRYRIEKELGRGGFGAVYSAWDSNVNRLCAVKENLDTSPEAQRQFAREASVLANLSHPNLPRVTDHFVLPGQGQYLVMDFVEGEDLASLLTKEKVIQVDKALEWISQVADALVYLHGRQPPVVHRDIKPANIRLTPEGKAMLVDFGLVKLYDPHLKTTMGARAVTPGYAPPEQYGKGSTDARSDIYALGATLYNLVTGQEPLESVQRIAGTKVPSPQEVNPAIPESIGKAIERAMALEPRQRFQSAAEFKAALLPSTTPSRGFPVQTIVAPVPGTYSREISPGTADVSSIPQRPEVVSPKPAAIPPSRASLGGVPPHPANVGAVQASPDAYTPGSTVLVRPAPEARTGASAGEIDYDAVPGRAGRQILPKATRSKGLMIGIAAAAVALFCIAAVVLGFILSAARTRTHQTQTAVAQVTSTANQVATSTGLAKQTSDAQATSTGQARATSTAKAQAAAALNAQRTATAQAWAAATAEAMNNLINTAQQWTLVMKDNFNDNSHNWPSGSESDEWHVSTLNVGEGIYRAEATAKKGFVTRLGPDMLEYSDLYIAVDILNIDGPSNQTCGLYFRDTGDNYYLFDLTNQGEFTVYLQYNGKWQELQASTASPNFKSGQPNRLVAIAQGTKFSFFINDQLATEIIDSQVASGSAGLIMSLYSAGDRGICEYGNFEFRVP